MANLTITNYDNAGVAIGGNRYEESVISFAGADDFAAGTLLGKNKIAAGTAAAGTNTGNGTVSAFVVVNSKELAKVGTYIFKLTAALVGDLIDPDGVIVAKGVALSDGAATVIDSAGIAFTITDGSTPFAANDTFNLPVVLGNGKYVVYSSSGVGGAEFPCAVLTYSLSNSSSGDVAIRPLIAGDVRKEKLVIDSGASLTAFEIDELNKNGIYAIPVNELYAQDNQ